MYLVAAPGSSFEQRDDQPAAPGCATAPVFALGGVAGWCWQLGERWRRRLAQGRERAAKRQMFILESLQVGPKQRVVLLKCGDDRFLIGTGPEGIQSIARVGAAPESGELPAVRNGGQGWSPGQ